MNTPPRFGPLELFSYDVIVADPPWLFENWSEKGEEKNASAQYPCVPLDEIKKLPVGHLAAPNCVLFLWVTNPLLEEGFEVLRSWGFRRAGFLTWNKKTKNGKTAWGPGYNSRCTTEHILMGFVGKPQHHKSLTTGFDAPVTKIHSQKPEESLVMFESYLTKPKKPKIVELFSRRPRMGWDTIGNEADKYPGTAGPDDRVVVMDLFPHLATIPDDTQQEMFLEPA